MMEGSQWGSKWDLLAGRAEGREGAQRKERGEERSGGGVTWFYLRARVPGEEASILFISSRFVISVFFLL